MNMQCPRPFKYATLLSLLLASVLALAGCANPEKAKAEHVSKGEAYLKESKFQEASIEFRNAIQLDDKVAAAHWGTFKLTDEPMDEPPARMRHEWRTAGLPNEDLWIMQHGETRRLG